VKSEALSQTLNVVITGAGRGLGLEFVKQLLPRAEWLIATARSPEGALQLQELAARNAGKLKIVQLDVSDEHSIHQAAEVMGKIVSSIDLLINNAGIYIGRPGTAAGSDKLGKLTMQSGVETFQTNAIGPMILTQTLLPLLEAAEPKGRIVSLTSGLASIANSAGPPFHYSASKAALNMYMHGLAAQVRKSGIISVVMNPGWVQTDMGGPGASITAEESARGILKVVDGLTLEQSGSFLNYKGQREPW
jgi:NAD(P)-dependent dehydrogenase (short-subunit alcohol dehydrogenase family)